MKITKFEVRKTASEVKYSDIKKYGDLESAFNAQMLEDMQDNSIVATFDNYDAATRYIYDHRSELTYIRDNYGSAVKYWLIKWAYLEVNQYNEEGEWIYGEIPFSVLPEEVLPEEV